MAAPRKPRKPKAPAYPTDGDFVKLTDMLRAIAGRERVNYTKERMLQAFDLAKSEAAKLTYPQA